MASALELRKVFLLSPANLNGLRAKQMMSPRSNSEAGRLYRTEEGVPIGIAFAFIADIDSPRHGIIRVHPQNLISLAGSLPVS